MVWPREPTPPTCPKTNAAPQVAPYIEGGHAACETRNAARSALQYARRTRLTHASGALLNTSDWLDCTSQDSGGARTWAAENVTVRSDP
eukprot:1637903-Pyramimonas_sp.AAC.1